MHCNHCRRDNAAHSFVVVYSTQQQWHTHFSCVLHSTHYTGSLSLERGYMCSLYSLGQRMCSLYSLGQPGERVCVPFTAWGGGMYVQPIQSWAAWREGMCSLHGQPRERVCAAYTVSGSLGRGYVHPLQPGEGVCAACTAWGEGMCSL